MPFSKGQQDVDHVSIDRNRIYSNSWYTVHATSGTSVLAVRDSDAGGGGAYKIRFTDNTVHDNETKVKWDSCDCYSDGNGIIVDILKEKPGGEPDRQGRGPVANSVSFANGGSGLHAFNSQHVDMVHNTAYHNSRSSRMESYANIFALRSKDVRILKNASYDRCGERANTATPTPSARRRPRLRIPDHAHVP